MERKKYCVYCNRDVDYVIKEITVPMDIKGIEFDYLANIAYCEECKEEIYVAELDDENVRRANRIYRDLQDIIQVNEIEMLLDKYDIGKKPLAKLLGWGEATIIRYINGLTPSREYSDRLKELLNNPYSMKDILIRNKARVSLIASKRLENRINEILEPRADNDEEHSTFNVSKFFLNRIDPEAGEVITHLKLQKLVYYVQAWNLAFFGIPFFTEDCQAWVHGPVFPELYERYKNYGYQPLDKVKDFDEKNFNPKQRYILKIIWNVYGKYDAKYLEYLTHAEEPWLNVRKGYDEDVRSNVVIGKQEIKDFYTKIKDDHKIEEIKDFERYISYVDGQIKEMRSGSLNMD